MDWPESVKTDSYLARVTWMRPWHNTGIVRGVSFKECWWTGSVEQVRKEDGSRALTGFGNCFSVPADPPPVPQMQALSLVSRPYQWWQGYNYQALCGTGTCLLLRDAEETR